MLALIWTLGLAMPALPAHGALPMSPRTAPATGHMTLFQCAPSFSGPKDGIGVCSGRLDVSFRGAPAALKAAEFSCEVLLRYWWRDGKEKRWEWKSVQVTAPAAQLGNRFADAAVEFRTDLTSIINEPRGADVKQVQCDITYQTM